MRHVIVGDGVAGHTAAETIREAEPDADIHVFTRENVPFYDRIGLRDYIRGGRERSDLVFDDGADWYADRDIDLHLATAVVDIDRDEQVVVTADGGRQEYDRLLLATGGTPRTLPFEKGVDGVHHLWTLAGHGDPLRRDLEAAETGTVIGGGLLGFDLIGSFSEVVDATYLVREDRWWHSVLTMDGAEIVHDAMRDAGIDLRLEEECTGMKNQDGRVHLATDRGEHEADVVGVAVGNELDTELAGAAGIEVDAGILCDETLQTDDPDIYAAGDAAEYRDPVLERRNIGGSWVTAQVQGETAGRNMVGADEPVEFVDTYTVTHFGLNVAALGDPVAADHEEVITAVDRDAQVYRKVVLDGDRIVGAAIIGAMQWMHPLKQLILQKKDVSGRRDDFSDPGFDPGDLL
ncbi:MAG: FAD-dependent oxidoreductase [Candidatus Nanohaloarchaea archaeon]|nr:FAD-dependent oxidoreductase [Candidatus Nanohaloarchaea archaeon]